MHIEILDKPTLQKIKMNCDDIIDKKLLEFPMVEDVWSRSSFNIIVAKMGMGKTSLITNLVKTVFRKCFHNIYCFIPSNSRMSIDNDIYGKFLPQDQLFDNLTEENIESVYKELQENSKEEEFSLLIIDDFQTQLKNPSILKTLNKIITKMRHLRTTIFLLQQNYQALDKSLRELASNLILFNVGKSQLEKIFLESIQLDKSKYQELIDLSFKEKHDWILINLNGQRNIYRMFDKIII
jgi:DNA replication protein DnaC